MRHIEDAVERGCDLDVVEVVFELEGAGAKAPKKLEWKTIESASKDPRWEAEIKPAVLGEIKKIFEVYKSVELVPKREMLETMAKHGKKSGVSGGDGTNQGQDQRRRRVHQDQGSLRCR